HVHGGQCGAARGIGAALTVHGVRLAEAGEFARRAFDNGKLDLTEIEGLADLINAETEAQARQALAQAEGSARALFESWRDDLIKAQALAEAGLDFADEADVAADATVEDDACVGGLLASILQHLSDRPGVRLRPRFPLAVPPPPHVR